MDIDYEKLIDKVIPNVWYTNNELAKVWGVPKKIERARIQVLVKRKDFIRRGKTANIQYRLAYKYNETIHVTIEKPTGNGIIDAKLRKEAGLPKNPTSLEELINAATKLGTENEILRKALNEAKTTIEKVLETK